MGNVHGVARPPRLLSAGTALALSLLFIAVYGLDRLAHVPAPKRRDVVVRVGAKHSLRSLVDRPLHVARSVLHRGAIPVRGSRRS